jgi:hypothetical protein
MRWKHETYGNLGKIKRKESGRGRIEISVSSDGDRISGSPQFQYG